MTDRPWPQAAKRGRRLFWLLAACAAASTVCGVQPRCRAAEPHEARQTGPLRAAYVYAPNAHAAANREGRNYWDAYLREIVEQLGLPAGEIPPGTLADAAALEQYTTLLVGGLDAHAISAETPANLTRWVADGGTLILFATGGLHDLCGNAPLESTGQPDGEFSCAGTFALQPHPLTEGIHSPLKPQQRLLIFSRIEKVRAVDSVELARLFELDKQDAGCAAVSMRPVGKGRVFYWAFSVPQTMWVLHQGRPVDRDYDGDQLLRRSDAVVIRPHAIEVAYADEILLLLQNMVASQPQPLVHQLPPDRHGGIPDAVFHWGGDDEGSAEGIQLFASNWMKAHGLPYHINAMPRKDGTFGLTPQDAQQIRANGHEISLHFNFVDGFGPGAAFSRDDVLAQAAAFRRSFGQDWVCSVNHYTRWTGWAEPAKWMLEAGGKADNTFVHAGSPPSNPTNLMGYSFGTAFPFWFYDDWAGHNRRIDFLEQPITAYECGYVGQQRPDLPTIHNVVDTAAYYHQTMNTFYHPIYIANFPHCRTAIEEMLRYLDGRKIAALHWGSDAVYSWWKARSSTRLSEVVVDEQELRLEVNTDHETGVVVKISISSKDIRSVTVNGSPAKFKAEQRFGREWLLVVVPRGRCKVQVRLS